MLPKPTLHLLIHRQQAQLKLYSTILPEAKNDEPKSCLYCAFFHAIPAPLWKVKMKRQHSAMTQRPCAGSPPQSPACVSISKILHFQDRMVLHFSSLEVFSEPQREFKPFGLVWWPPLCMTKPSGGLDTPELHLKNTWEDEIHQPCSSLYKLLNEIMFFWGPF